MSWYLRPIDWYLRAGEWIAKHPQKVFWLIVALAVMVVVF